MHERFHVHVHGRAGRQRQRQVLGRPAREKEKREQRPNGAGGRWRKGKLAELQGRVDRGCKRQRGLSSRVVAKPRHASVMRGWAGLGWFAGGFAMHALLRCTFRQSEGATSRSMMVGLGRIEL